jgi:hypothetical protein
VFHSNNKHTVCYNQEPKAEQELYGRALLYSKLLFAVWHENVFSVEILKQQIDNRQVSKDLPVW